MIRPRLEEWAEVATFDVPGVGDEPAVEPLDRRAIIDRALGELDRRGWDSYILVCDGSALPTGVRIAHARRDAVEAMALGHARLVNRMEGDRPTVNKEVMEAFAQLGESNYPDFIRYGLTQVTHGSIGDELAARMLERVPLDVESDRVGDEPARFRAVRRPDPRHRRAAPLRQTRGLYRIDRGGLRGRGCRVPSGASRLGTRRPECEPGVCRCPS